MGDKILKEKPFPVDKKLNKSVKDQSPHPFISVDAHTGARTEVATAVEDIRNRQALARQRGVPVGQISAGKLENLPA